jgi:hypothetical protein
VQAEDIYRVANKLLRKEMFSAVIFKSKNEKS